MNGFKKITFKDDINRISLKIERHIQENSETLFFKTGSINKILTENYISLLIRQNEYDANEFLHKIESNLSLYHQDEMTRHINSIEKEISISIKNLFINSAKLTGRKYEKIKKERVSTLIAHHISGVFLIKLNNKKVILNIDNEKEIFKLIDTDGEAEFFYDKESLINKIEFLIKDDSNENLFEYKYYKEKEYLACFNVDNDWKVTPEYVKKEVVNQIKYKGEIYLTESISILLDESYSYKSIFIIKDKENKQEKILHIYLNDVETAFSIAKERYQQVEGNGEYLLYKIGTGWFITKAKDRVIKKFSQYHDLLKPLEKILSRVNLIASSETNYDFSRVSSSSGLCYGLSLNYLLEVRNNSFEGGNKYLFWLKEKSRSYGIKNEVVQDKIDTVLTSIIQEYEILNLIKELKNISIAQHYQRDRIFGNEPYFIFDSMTANKYSQILQSKGLEKLNINNVAFSQDKISAQLDNIVANYNEYYAVIAFKNHAIAISYKKYSDNYYKFTLFDSNVELIEFSDINSIKETLLYKMDFYGASEIDGKGYVIFDEYKKSKTIKYDSIWNSNEIDTNKGIAKEFIKIGFSLPFNDNVMGRVVSYTMQRDLIIELKKGNKLIDVIIKDTHVDEGIYFVKYYLDKIIENDKASKVILTKTESDDVEITVAEISSHKEIKKPKGYIEFDDFYYKNLIEINSHLLKGEKQLLLNKIAKSIDVLSGNIYFNKLVASFSLINDINEFNNDNVNISLVKILNKVKEKLEIKLFYDKLIHSKNNLIALSEKNSAVAAKLYQTMVSEINHGESGISNFIYNQIIESPYLPLDKKTHQGVIGYDYTIVFKENYQYLRDIIENIDIPELKNTFLLEEHNVLHLKENYRKLLEYRGDENIDKLLTFIENEIKIKNNDVETSEYSNCYLDYYTNNQFNNRKIISEINHLENYYNQNYREHRYSYHPENFYINEKDPSALLEKSLSQNKNEMDCSYLLFDDNKESFDFLFIKNRLITDKNIDNIILDNIDADYQDHILIYFYNGTKTETLIDYLKDKPEISQFLDYCKKGKIRVTVSGKKEDGIFYQDFVKQKNDVESLQRIILENQFFNERTLIFAKKEKLLSYQQDGFFIEGIAQRLNMPIYQVIDNQLSLSRERVIVKSSINRPQIDNPLLAAIASPGVVIAESEGDYSKLPTIKENTNTENEQYAKEIYQYLSQHQSDYRDSDDFKLGYQQDIQTQLPYYSEETTLLDIVDYIRQHHYELNQQQIGTLIRSVDEINAKQHKEKAKEVIDNIIHKKMTIEKACESYFDAFSAIFMTSNKNNIMSKLTQAIYDPLINKKFNQYLLDEATQVNWQHIETNKEITETLVEKTQNTIELVHAIYDNPSLIKKLSNLSINLLNTFFDDNKKGILYRVLLDTISSFSQYKKMINKLENIITLSEKSLISKEISPIKALKKEQILNQQLTPKVSDFILSKSESNIEEITINGKLINKSLLINLGVKVNGEKIEDIDFEKIPRWNTKLTLDAQHLNDYFLSLTGDEKDNEIIALLRYLLNNKKEKIKYLLGNNVNRTDYLSASERLNKIIELGEKKYQKKDWDTLRKASLNIPRHMSIISKIGYANMTYGMWQSVNATFTLAEQLNNPLLTLQQRKDIINNLAIMWSEMAFNGISEIIEITLAKGLLKYRHNPLEYVNKLSTRVGIGLNMLSIGFDIYSAYDNFSQISDEGNVKRQIDYIVNGTFAVVSGLVTLGVSIGMLAGSTLAGPIGIVAGAIIALATSIYNAARLIELAKEKINFTPLEELNNGFYAFIMGDILPNKRNDIVYLETESQLEQNIDNNAASYLDEIKKQNTHSRYFYTNEKQVYQAHYYYKVVPNLLGEKLDKIVNPLGDYIANRIAQKMSQTEAETIAALSYHLRAEKTEYQYYLPKEAIATNETLVFDLDFYVNELNRYTMDIITDDESSIFDEIVTSDFIEEIKSTKENTIKLLTENLLSKDLIKSTEQKIYCSGGWRNDEVLYFNTYNGNDIIAAPLVTQNVFDIYNGIKRLSGGIKNDVFNLFTSESPNYASRFYGREGNDTLRLIKTTGKYTGYEVNLSENYVKFKHSEEQTNSQNFHSKLFLYEDNGRIYSKIFADSMPNVMLQNQKVIAYLDSIENVIGSEMGDDVIYGNDEANYLDGIAGSDLLYGLGGNDTLALKEGYAEGGEGNDQYVILSAALSQDYNKIFEVIINEINNKETSVVRLSYNLEKISAITRDKKDIIIHIKASSESECSKLVYHTVRLKNAYEQEHNKTLSHRYTLMTEDSFILTANEDNNSSALYQLSYLENDHNTLGKVNKIDIDEKKQLLTVSTKDKIEEINLLPEIKYSGLSSGKNLTLAIQGNEKDNHYFAITANSSIKLSQGNDSYHIKTFLAKNKHDAISILLSENTDTLTQDCASYFFLSEVSGFDLTFNHGVLSHRYLPDTYLKLIFEPQHLKQIFHSGMKIHFIDKDNVTFTLPIQESGSRLLKPVTDLNLAITTGDDVLMIPESLLLNKETRLAYIENSQTTLLSALPVDKRNNAIDLLPVIELKDGDDIVVNHNKTCSVIDGGKGDDHIVVNRGHHILIAGEGDDNVNAGTGNDVLISQFGHDYLSGGSGNNVYLVQKRQGNVTVYDEGKNSTIFVTGLTENEKLISSQVEDDMQYHTADKQFVLTVKSNPTYLDNQEDLDNQENNAPVAVIEKAAIFSSQGLASLIQEMAQFNQQQLTTIKSDEVISSSVWSPLATIEKTW